MGPDTAARCGLDQSSYWRVHRPELRVGLAFPLDVPPLWGGSMDGEAGIVRNSQVLASVQHLPQVRFKDGSREAVSMLAVLMTREFSSSIYGVAQAGSAAVGKAGAYSFGMFGLGLQSPYVLGSTRFGAELLAGAAAVAAWRWAAARSCRRRVGPLGNLARQTVCACVPAWVIGAACVIPPRRHRC
ncbi:hypothetical protein ACVBEH_09840 [Roseateles sp. GG27B]